MNIYKTGGPLFLHKVVLQTLLFKERFHLGQNWTSKTGLQLLQNLKQEENKGGVQKCGKWYEMGPCAATEPLTLGLLGFMCLYVLQEVFISLKSGENESLIVRF